MQIKFIYLNCNYLYPFYTANVTERCTFHPLQLDRICSIDIDGRIRYSGNDTVRGVVTLKQENNSYCNQTEKEVIIYKCECRIIGVVIPWCHFQMYISELVNSLLICCNTVTVSYSVFQSHCKWTFPDIVCLKWRLRFCCLSSVVPIYCWKTPEAMVTVSIGDATAQFQVSINRSEPILPNYSTDQLECANFTINGNVSGKLKWA